jgi:hypothetical protein
MDRDVEPVVQWLIDGARSAATPQDVLANFVKGSWRAAFRCGVPQCSFARSTPT